MIDRDFIVDTLTREIADDTKQYEDIILSYGNSGDFYSTDDAYAVEYLQGKLAGLEYALQLITDTEAFRVGRLGYIETEGN